jgi:hypothetical protein
LGYLSLNNLFNIETLGSVVCKQNNLLAVGEKPQSHIQRLFGVQGQNVSPYMSTLGILFCIRIGNCSIKNNRFRSDFIQVCFDQFFGFISESHHCLVSAVLQIIKVGLKFLLRGCELIMTTVRVELELGKKTGVFAVILHFPHETPSDIIVMQRGEGIRVNQEELFGLTLQRHLCGKLCRR